MANCMNKRIFIFDIDQTLLQDRIPENLEDLLKFLLNYEDTCLYVITSRGFTSFINGYQYIEDKEAGCMYMDNKEEFGKRMNYIIDTIMGIVFEDTVSKNYNKKSKERYKKILRTFYIKNKDRYIDDWFYCQYSTDDMAKKVDNFLENNIIMKEFKKFYHKLISSSTRKKILRQNINSIYCNTYGVMLGSGEMWIRNIGYKKAKDELKIVTINY